MPDQIPPEVKRERSARLTAEQEMITDGILRGHIGKTVDVLFETFSDGIACGHTPSFIEVRVRAERTLRAELRKVRINGVADGGCTGELID